MVHPKVNNYHVLDVLVRDKKTKSEGNYDVFIGRIDGVYHLLGYRPQEAKAYFSENECASLDLGLVELPKGKASLRDLVKGDEITFKLDVKDPSKLWKVIYQRFT
jgi:hypothetical protein